MIEFNVDLNELRLDGLVRASRRRVQADVSKGDEVRVTDIADMSRYFADVVRVTDRAVELRVNLSSKMLPLESVEAMTDEYFGRVPEVRRPRRPQLSAMTESHQKILPAPADTPGLAGSAP